MNIMDLMVVKMRQNVHGWSWNFKEESPNIRNLVLLLHSIDEAFSFFLKVELVLCFIFMFLDAANGKAIKLSCELLQIFITEAMQRAATIAEAEGASKIEAIHLERILPQLLLDF
ncbi:protein mhf2 like protein [Quercus suber]|uniref:Protein mhf2 like protein n=1 Tax=Quercus suber TaxID=58331 RepID=A0AAW0LQF8_QUESU